MIQLGQCPFFNSKGFGFIDCYFDAGYKVILDDLKKEFNNFFNNFIEECKERK